MHLARSGRAPQAAIDKSYLSPHNFARHALYPHVPRLERDISTCKSQAFAQVVRTLNQLCQAYIGDVTATHTQEEWRDVFPRATWGVINATATLNVQEVLSALPRECLKARVIETSLLANGQLGLITVEGAKQNPNSGDLTALFYDRVCQDARLRQLLFGPNRHDHQQAIGNGCSSQMGLAREALASLLYFVHSLFAQKRSVDDVLELLVPI